MGKGQGRLVYFERSLKRKGGCDCTLHRCISIKNYSLVLRLLSCGFLTFDVACCAPAGDDISDEDAFQAVNSRGPGRCFPFPYDESLLELALFYYFTAYTPAFLLCVQGCECASV